MGEENTDTVNVALFATPSENLDVRARITVHRDDDGAPAGFLMGIETTGTDLRNCFSDPSFAGTRNYFCGAIPVIPAGQFGTNTFVGQDAVPYIFEQTPVRPVTDLVDLDHLGIRREAERYSLSVAYTLPESGIIISSITGYNEEDTDQIRDGDWDEVDFQYTLFGRNYEDFSQELRVTSDQDQPLRWLVGGNYFDLTVDKGAASRLPLPTFGVFPFPTFVFISEGLVFRQKVKTTALFGAADYDINDQLSLSLEARYQWDKIDQGVTPQGFALKTTFKKFLPRVILQYQPSDETNVYATFARGNKPGTFNTAFTALTPDQQQQVEASIGAAAFVPEENLSNFELGWKQSVLDGQASFSSAAYFME